MVAQSGSRMSGRPSLSESASWASGVPSPSVSTLLLSSRSGMPSPSESPVPSTASGRPSPSESVSRSSGMPSLSASLKFDSSRSGMPSPSASPSPSCASVKPSASASRTAFAASAATSPSAALVSPSSRSQAVSSIAISRTTRATKAVFSSTKAFRPTIPWSVGRPHSASRPELTRVSPPRACSCERVGLEAHAASMRPMSQAARRSAGGRKRRSICTSKSSITKERW
mmetsp:Transcript_21220/g.67580  ORF Transcript_21220/g.67580 Transcript_21220/m.67580 type:complete len:228 (+) Transcript_21220:344-1027(+)